MESTREAWRELHPRFRRAVSNRGVAAAVRLIPASKSTVYRLLADEHARPHRSILRGAEQFCAQSVSARPTP